MNRTLAWVIIISLAISAVVGTVFLRGGFGFVFRAQAWSQEFIEARTLAVLDYAPGKKGISSWITYEDCPYCNMRRANELFEEAVEAGRFNWPEHTTAPSEKAYNSAYWDYINTVARSLPWNVLGTSLYRWPFIETDTEGKPLPKHLISGLNGVFFNAGEALNRIEACLYGDNLNLEELGVEKLTDDTSFIEVNGKNVLFPKSYPWITLSIFRRWLTRQYPPGSYVIYSGPICQNEPCRCGITEAELMKILTQPQTVSEYRYALDFYQANQRYPSEEELHQAQIMGWVEFWPAFASPVFQHEVLADASVKYEIDSTTTSTAYDWLYRLFPDWQQQSIESYTYLLPVGGERVGYEGYRVPEADYIDWYKNPNSPYHQPLLDKINTLKNNTETLGLVGASSQTIVEFAVANLIIEDENLLARYGYVEIGKRDPNIRFLRVGPRGWGVSIAATDNENSLERYDIVVRYPSVEGDPGSKLFRLEKFVKAPIPQWCDTSQTMTCLAYYLVPVRDLRRVGKFASYDEVLQMVQEHPEGEMPTFEAPTVAGQPRISRPEPKASVVVVPESLTVSEEVYSGRLTSASTTVQLYLWPGAQPDGQLGKMPVKYQKGTLYLSDGQEVAVAVILEPELKPMIEAQSEEKMKIEHIYVPMENVVGD